MDYFCHMNTFGLISLTSCAIAVCVNLVYLVKQQDPPNSIQPNAGIMHEGAVYITVLFMDTVDSLNGMMGVWLEKPQITGFIKSLWSCYTNEIGQSMCNCDMGLLPDTQNCGLRMRQECRERFPRHRLQRKSLVSDTGMHHDTCVRHVPWCMSVSLTCSGREKHSRHSRRMRNQQFCVSGKRPMLQYVYDCTL